jgi:GNAT superfamily N-acetyltransferase
MDEQAAGRLHSGVRPARAGDVDRLRELIVELAGYERARDQVRVTREQLHTALFGREPAAYALVAEASTPPGTEVVGFALYFLNFSTWEGVHGIYLEDLYVAPEHRGTGLGRALLQSLAAIAVDRGYARFEWSVLNWNQPSIDFYTAVGAVPLVDWTTYRLSGPALTAVANGQSAPRRDGSVRGARHQGAGAARSPGTA